MLMLDTLLKFSVFLNFVCLWDLNPRVFNLANFLAIKAKLKTREIKYPLNKAAAIIIFLNQAPTRPLFKLILTLTTFMY